jgi:Protein of unknown function (DUF3592)
VSETNAKPGLEFWKALLIGLSMLGVSLGIMVFLLNDAIQVVKSWSWPSQNGIVQSTQVDRQNGKGGRTYLCTVTYTYNVDNVAYTGTTQRFEKNFLKSEQASIQECQKWAVNSTISLKVEPQNPSWACYDCRIAWGSLVIIALVIPIACVGFVVLALLIQAYLPARKSST